METMHAAGRRRLPPVPRPAGDRQAAAQLTAERPDAVGADGARADTALIDTALIDTRQIAAELVEAELAAMAAAPARPQDPGDPVVEPRGAEVPDAATDSAVPGDDDPGTAVDDTALDDTALDDTALDDTARFEPVDALPEEPAEIPRPAAEEHPVEAARSGNEQQVDAAEPAIEPERSPVDTPSEDHDPAQQFVARLRSSAADFAGAAGAESAVVREAVPPARHRRARCRLVLRYTDGTETDVTLLGPAGRPGRPSRHGFDRQILRWLGSGLARDDAWLTEDPDAPDGIAIDLTAWVASG